MGRNLSNLYISQSYQYVVQISGSELQNGVGSKLTGSLSITASLADNAISASYALKATSSSYADTAGNVNTGSLLVTASINNATTTFTKGDGSTFDLTVNNVNSASYALSSSYALTATTSSYSISATTASFANSFTASNLLVTGFATISSASITYLDVVYQTSSVVFSTGSNKLGDASDDIQTLWGTVTLPSGPLLVTGSAVITGGVTSNLTGTASYATQALTASYANQSLSSSYASQATSASYSNNSTSASYSLSSTTSSYSINGLSASYSDLSSTASYIATASNAIYALTASYLAGGGTSLVPVGSITMYGGSSAPAGFLLCDGTAYNRTTYAALYSVIGDSFGAGDLSTTFNVPKFNGRMPIGAGSAAGLTTRTLAVSGGVENQILTENQMPPHSHSVSIMGGSYFGGTTFDATQQTSAYYNTVNTSVAGGDVSGSAQSFSIMNPFLGINFIIKY